MTDRLDNAPGRAVQRPPAHNQAFLAKLSDRLRTLLDPVEVMQVASAAIGEELGVDQVSYAEIELDAGIGVVHRDWNSGRMPTNAGYHELDDFGPYIEELKRGETVIVDNVQSDRRAETDRTLDAFADVHVASVIAVPLVKNGIWSAMLSVQCPSARTWSADDVELVKETAERTWDAVERARVEAALSASEMRYQALFDAMEQGFCMVEVRFEGDRADYRVVEANPAFYDRTGFPHEILGRWLREAAPDLEEHWFETYGRVARTGDPARFEEESKALGRWFDVYAFRYGAPEDRRVAILFNDVTERKRHDERVQLLLAEINHRSKNMLSLVLAIASASIGRNTGKAGEDFLNSFRQRLMALSINQDLLISGRWEGVALRPLVEAQLGHFDDLLDDRILLDGPPLVVTRKASETISMALHELATNAGKYGSLSTPQGRVEISWAQLDDERGPRFEISWRESDGPPVAEPARRGFGSQIIKDVARGNLAADVELAFAPEGVRWTLNAPADRCIEAHQEPPPEAAPRASSVRGQRGAEPLSGRVLVVEDESLIAAGLARSLSEAGHQILGPVGSSFGALELLKREACDAAVLDVNLGQGTSAKVAETLANSEIPFVAVTGYSRDQVPEAFANAPLLSKPLEIERLLTELENCLDAGNAPAQKN